MTTFMLNRYIPYHKNILFISILLEKLMLREQKEVRKIVLTSQKILIESYCCLGNDNRRKIFYLIEKYFNSNNLSKFVILEMSNA